MSTINSICELINYAGCQFVVHDMGRVIRRIDSQQLLDIEYNKQPYPYPIQNHALFSIAFWNPEASRQHYIWFVKLPLDEQGLLITAARNEFLESLVKALGDSLQQAGEEYNQQQLQQNPYIFQPNTHKLAVYNALLRKYFAQPMSQYYQSAIDLLSIDYPNWQQLPLQGLADIVIYADLKVHTERLERSIRHQTDMLYLRNLSLLLENSTMPQKIALAVIDTLKQAGELDQLELIPHWLRSLAQASPAIQQRALDIIYQQDLSPNALKEILIVIAGRLWMSLNSAERTKQYFEIVAQQQDAVLFRQLFADLVAIPQLRPMILSLFRDSERSATLSKAIGELFKQHDRSI